MTDFEKDFFAALNDGKIVKAKRLLQAEKKRLVKPTFANLSGMCDIYAGDFGHAVYVLKSANNEFPENCDILVNLAFAYRANNDNINAVVTCLKILPLLPENETKKAVMEMLRDIRTMVDGDKYPFYIPANPYRNSSSGVRFLHYLCDKLVSLGYEAYVITDLTNEKLNTPRLTDKIVAEHSVQGKLPIYVLAEVYRAEMFDGSFVYGGVACPPCVTAARLLLNKADHIAVAVQKATGEYYPPITFGENELFFHSSEAFISGEKNSQLIRVFTTDRSAYYPPKDDAAREGFGYYAHKYAFTGFTVSDAMKEGATDLSLGDGLINAMEPEQLGAIFRKLKAVYTYEPTGTSVEALMCGCPAYTVDTPYMDEFVAAWDENYIMRISSEDAEAFKMPYIDFEQFNADWLAYENDCEISVRRLAERMQGAMKYLLYNGTLKGFEDDEE